MKTNNQTEHDLLELAIAKAANEEGFGSARDADTVRTQAWSPLEVWRTRVKSAPPVSTGKPAQI